MQTVLEYLTPDEFDQALTARMRAFSAEMAKDRARLLALESTVAEMSKRIAELERVPGPVLEQEAPKVPSYYPRGFLIAPMIALSRDGVP